MLARTHLAVDGERTYHTNRDRDIADDNLAVSTKNLLIRGKNRRNADDGYDG